MMPRKAEENTPVSLTLVTGPEELLAERAVAAVTASVRAVDPDLEIQDVAGAELAPGMLGQLSSPSLFGERKVVIIRGTHELGAETFRDVAEYLDQPFEQVSLVLVHSGGARGKAVLELARKAGAREVACAKITRPADRVAFVCSEFQDAGRVITEDAAHDLLDAVGTDLFQIVAACGQLLADTTGVVDGEVVSRYYTGRAEVTSFMVADRVMEGRIAEALEQLRWALSVGTAPVLVTSALAQGLRHIALLGSAPRGLRSVDLARKLGMPVWKIDRVRRQLGGWTEWGVARALQVVGEADGAVKGGSDDAAYALERAVIYIVQARGAH